MSSSLNKAHHLVCWQTACRRQSKCLQQSKPHGYPADCVEISVKKLFAILIFLFATSCASQNIGREEKLIEFEVTDSNTQCKTDTDCWCQSFDGVEFKNKKDTSICCNPSNPNCTKPGFCIECLYD